jgi:hypothetical protein
MRSILSCCYFILPMLLLSVKSDSSKKELLCHRWIQVASKKNIASSPQMIDKSMAKEIIFKNDGTYEDAIYNGQFKTTGKYFLNQDTTKMEFMVSSINGKAYPPFPEESRHYNVIILKLTADTLIYGNEFYIGKDSKNMVYDHSDQYFVRKN